MERDVLLDAGSSYPTFDNLVGVTGCIYVLEYRFVGFATRSHQYGSLRGNVEIFLSAGFLLFKDDAGKVALLLHVLPSEAYNVRSSQAGKAREQEHPLGCSVIARGFRQGADFVHGKVHAIYLYGLGLFYTKHGVTGEVTFFESLSDAGLELTEVAVARIGRQGGTFGTLAGIAPPGSGPMLQIVAKSVDPFRRDL